MKRWNRRLIWLLPAFVLIVVPSSALAWSYSVSPAVEEISNISPGGKAEFSLVIHNKDNVNHTFMLTTYSPRESERRRGKAEFPDSSWVNLSAGEIEVAAGSVSEAQVTVAIPAEREWANKDWEIWLSIMPADDDLFLVNYYVRLLISTTGPESDYHLLPIVGAVAGAAGVLSLIVWGVTKRKAK